MGILSTLILLPLLAIPFVLFVPKEKIQWAKYIALSIISIQFILTIFIYFGFKNQPAIGINTSNLAFSEHYSWLSFSLGNYGVFCSELFFGLDGLNVLLVVLSGFILFIAMIASWKVNKKEKAYFSLFLLLSSSIFGCFASLDLLVFFIFFEFMLLPMYFLIGIWGGEKRQYAAIKFFLYTMVGSTFILAVILGLYASVIDPLKTGFLLGFTGDTDQIISQTQQLLLIGDILPSQMVHSFNMTYLLDPNNIIPTSILDPNNSFHWFGYRSRELGFLFLFIGFGIKLPLVPLHTWLPDAHVQAPTPVSIILAGILLKIGGYGLIRLGFTIFPDGAQTFSWLIGFISMITIVYGAYVAMGQKNLKRLIAYSSVSHMGFVTLGLVSYNALGMTGAIYQMVSHGLIASMLFFAAGILSDRTKNLEISDYSGLASKMPYFTAFVVVAFFASLGLPGFSGFIGEAFVFLGIFDSAMNFNTIPYWMVGFSLLGLVLTAAYYLWTLQRMFFGKYWVKDANYWNAQLIDLNARELGIMVVLSVMVLLFGIMPSLLTDLITPSIDHLTRILR